MSSFAFQESSHSSLLCNQGAMLLYPLDCFSAYLYHISLDMSQTCPISADSSPAPRPRPILSHSHFQLTPTHASFASKAIKIESPL